MNGGACVFSFSFLNIIINMSNIIMTTFISQRYKFIGTKHFFLLSALWYNGRQHQAVAD